MRDLHTCGLQRRELRYRFPPQGASPHRSRRRPLTPPEASLSRRAAFSLPSRAPVRVRVYRWGRRTTVQPLGVTKVIPCECRPVHRPHEARAWSDLPPAINSGIAALALGAAPPERRSDATITVGVASMGTQCHPLPFSFTLPSTTSSPLTRRRRQHAPTAREYDCLSDRAAGGGLRPARWATRRR